MVGADAVTPVPGGFRVACTLDGPSAKDLNRDLLSALRRVVKKTRLRARWTADGTTERFFDYVPKAVSEAPAGPPG